MFTLMPFVMPRPGIAGGMNTFHDGSGIVASIFCRRSTIAAADWSLPGRFAQSLRSTISMHWFSPRPPTIEKPVMVSTLRTSGTSLRSFSTARSDTSRVRSRVDPSGISRAANTTHWSSSGRNDVCVERNICTVSITVSTSSTAARKMRLASHFAALTNIPLKALIIQLNHASGPCLYGLASCRMSEHNAGASVSAHTVEKHTAAESVTENCW